jgi:hypothetical protein
LAAAEHERLKRRALLAAASRDERTDALGTVDLVCAHADQFNAGVAEPFELARKALGRIDVEIRVRIAQAVSDLANRLDNTRLIVDVHDRNEQGVGSNRVEEHLRVHLAVVIRAHFSDLEAALLQLGKRLENRMMLDGGRNDVSAALRSGGQPKNREVVAFRGTACENHVAAARVDHGGNLIARTFDRCPGALAPRVRAASGVAEVRVEVPKHLVANPLV